MTQQQIKKLCKECRYCDPNVECAVKAAGVTFKEWIDYLDENGCACGIFKGMMICRFCPSIRNGDCDGPIVHCADTECPHKNLDKCPVDRSKCDYCYC